MKYTTMNRNPDAVKTDLLIVGCFQEEVDNSSSLAPLNEIARGAMLRQAAVEGFSGKATESFVYFPDGKLKPKRILVLGLGRREKFGLEDLRKTLTSAFRKVRALKVPSVSVALFDVSVGCGITPELYGRVVAEYSGLVDYVINHFKTERGGHKGDFHIRELRVFTRGGLQKKLVETGIAKGIIYARAVNKTRDLSNLPANILTPTALAEEVRKVGKSSNGRITYEIHGRPWLIARGAEGVLAVNKGSYEEPTFSIATYTPKDPATDEVLCLVGKSITFDSGGLNLKSGDGMLTMKRDMSGGAAALAALEAIAALELPIKVIAILPATENMPDGKAYRPGDVIKTMAGLTVEIVNTDAEGRLTLAEGVEQARRCGATKILTIATLTGAQRSISADAGAAAFGNNTKFSSLVMDAAEAVDERMIEIPMWNEFRSGNHSDIADLKNSGGDPGSVTAAWFIREFVGDTDWMHLDIAGPSYRGREHGADPKGATGYGTRILIEVASALALSKS